MNERKLTCDQQKEAVRLYVEEGLYLQETSKRLGVCASTVRRALREAGVKMRKVGGQEKELTDEEIAEYERRKAEVTKQKELELSQRREPRGEERKKFKKVFKFAFNINHLG